MESGHRNTFSLTAVGYYRVLATQDFLLSSKIVTAGGVSKSRHKGTTSHYLPNRLARPELMRTVKSGK